MPGWWCEIAITGDSSVTLERRAGNYSASMGRCVIRALGEMFICGSLGTWINEPVVSAPAFLFGADQIFLMSTQILHEMYSIRAIQCTPELHCIIINDTIMKIITALWLCSHTNILIWYVFHRTKAAFYTCSSFRDVIICCRERVLHMYCI